MLLRRRLDGGRGGGSEERIHLHVLPLELRLADVAALFLFPSPFLFKGVKGEILFSPSLFFDFADGDPPPVDNSSVFIGFSFRVFRCLCQPAIRLSLRSACSLPHGSRTPSRGGYPRPREIQYLPSGQNQTKKDPPAPSQKVLIRHKKRRIDYRCAIAI